MRKAQLEDGVVVNVIEVDPGNIPPWCADWPDACHAPQFRQAEDPTAAPPEPEV